WKLVKSLLADESTFLMAVPCVAAGSAHLGDEASGVAEGLMRIATTSGGAQGAAIGCLRHVIRVPRVGPLLVAIVAGGAALDVRLHALTQLRHGPLTPELRSALERMTGNPELGLLAHEVLESFDHTTTTDAELARCFSIGTRIQGTRRSATVSSVLKLGHL